MAVCDGPAAMRGVEGLVVCEEPGNAFRVSYGASGNIMTSILVASAAFLETYLSCDPLGGVLCSSGKTFPGWIPDVWG